MSGPEFNGSESLEVSDISDWIVEGMGGEVAKTVLDDFEWDGNAVGGITIMTSPDNKKVANANLFLAGELMKGVKEIRANRLFGEADRDLRVVYQIEEASLFTFRSGTTIGELVDDDKISWHVIRKTSRATNEVEVADYESNNIGRFSI